MEAALSRERQNNRFRNSRFRGCLRRLRRGMEDWDNRFLQHFLIIARLRKTAAACAESIPRRGVLVI
jgi:hypothetical protein